MASEGGDAAAAADDAGTAGNDQSKYIINTGPRSDIRYPVTVIYCGECSMPVEYCEYLPNYEKCKAWMVKNLPEDMQTMMLTGKEEVDDCEEKKRQKRGGRGVVKAKKKSVEQHITIARQSRGKRKFVTIITGLSTYEIELVPAGKALGKKFACGASVTGTDEITVQGDVKDDLWDYFEDKWPEIEEDSIEDLGDLKKGR